MGVSGSSLLDETKTAFIRGEAEAELSRFAPFYRKQFSVARFSQAQNDLEQQQQTTTGLLKQRAPPAGGEVLYEDAVLYFDESRKWRERYVVVRANFSLELHDGLDTFLKGAPACHRLLPTGGAVLTTEERYMQLVDHCFPDDSSVKEDFAPPLASMPGQFPVYLRLPYRRDSYFCFKQQLRQENFISILWDCIRHQNQDFLKKSSCEVKAFVKAVQFYRESQGKYSSWNMLMGSDVRVLSNAVMERLLPTLEKDLLPKLKAKKTEKKRVWFATVEAAYIVVQETLLERLSQLKEQCRTSVKQQEVLIHADMDQILRSREQLQERVQAVVSAPAELLCSEKVRPFLWSVLEDLMEVISHSFTQGRQLSAGLMEQVTEEVLQDQDELKKVLLSMSRPRLFDCFQKMASLEDQTEIKEKFNFTNVRGIVHSAQIDLQQLVENASFTFENLLNKALEDNQENAANVNKISLRVLKYFDYDSSALRKKIFEDALVQITLPFIKEQLQEQRTQLRDAAEHVLLDHCDFIDTDNVYEEVLLHVLRKDISSVLQEASRLQKYNLLTNSRDLLSRSSLSSVGSAPASPALSPASSPCAANHSLPPVTAPDTPTTTQEVQAIVTDVAYAIDALTNGNVVRAQVENTNPENTVKVTVEEISDILEQSGKEILVQTEQATESQVEDGVVKVSDAADDVNKLAAASESDKMAENSAKDVESVVEKPAGAEVNISGIQDEVFDVGVEKPQDKETEDVQKVQEETVQKQEEALVTNQAQFCVSAENVLNEDQKKEQEESAAHEGVENKTLPAVLALTTAAAAELDPAPETNPALSSEEGHKVSERQEEEAHGESATVPSGGEEEVTADKQLHGGKDPEGTREEVRTKEAREEREEDEEEECSDDEGSTTSDILEKNSQSLPSSEEESIQSEERSGATQETSKEEVQPKAETHPEQQRPLEEQCPLVEAVSAEGRENAEETSAEGASAEGATAEGGSTEQQPQEGAEHLPEERPLDCIRAIRDLVEEVIEVEELVHRYPSGVPTELQSPDQNQD